MTAADGRKRKVQTANVEGLLRIIQSVPSPAKKGGKIAGDARVALEKETGKSIVTEENYLQLSEKKKRRLK